MLLKKQIKWDKNNKINKMKINKNMNILMENLLLFQEIFIKNSKYHLNHNLDHQSQTLW